MRRRKRTDTRVTCYRFRCYLPHQNNDLLPDSIFRVAERQRALWNSLAVESSNRYSEWKKNNATYRAWVAFDGGKTRPPKPDQEYYAKFNEWARRLVSDSGLNWECGPDILDRFYSVLKRLRHGGGEPRINNRLDHFTILHRYPGGIRIDTLGRSGQKRFRIIFPPTAAYLDSSRNSRRQRGTRAWFDVYGEVVPMRVMMHRQIPGNAIVKRVMLNGVKQSPAMRWQFYLIFMTELPIFQSEPQIAKKTVGIDVGWRKMSDDRMRVAVSYDGHRHRELYLDLSWKDKNLGEISLSRRAGIRRAMDRLLEHCKTKLLPMLNPRPPGFVRMRNGGLIRLLSSDISREAKQCIMEWKRESDNFSRTAMMIENKLRGRRLHRYQEYAAELASEYSEIKIEKLNVARLVALPSKDPCALQASGERRGYAAVGSLLQAIRYAAQKRGVDLIEVNSSHTTDICAECGSLFEAGVNLRGRCVAGHERDQDWNAAENIYAKLLDDEAQSRLSN